MVTSYPEGAKVRVDGREVCKATPCRISVAPGTGNPVVIVEKEGYQTATQEIRSAVEPLFLLNIFSPLWVGFTVDYMNGTAFKHRDNAIHVELQKR